MKIRSKYDSITVNVKWNGKSSQFQKIVSSKKIKPNTYLIINLTKTKGTIYKQRIDNENISSILIMGPKSMSTHIIFRNVVFDDTNIRVLELPCSFRNVSLNNSYFILEGSYLGITRTMNIFDSILEIRDSRTLLFDIKRFIIHGESKLYLKDGKLNINIDENAIKQKSIFKFMYDRFKYHDPDRIVLHFSNIDIGNYLKEKNKRIPLTNLSEDQCVFDFLNFEPDVDIAYSFFMIMGFILFLSFMLFRK